jgi:DNA-binding NarL/FixJ family response regulator
MIPIISVDDPQGPNTLEQMNKNNVTIHAHSPVLRPPLPIKTSEDDVTLSHRAKALHLKAQGCSLQEIAIIMDLDTKTVTGYDR